MIDKTEAALALAAAGIIPSIYNAALPPLAVARADTDPDGNLAAAETAAGLTGLAIVAGLALATRSRYVAVAGLVSLIALSASFRRAVAHIPNMLD